MKNLKKIAAFGAAAVMAMSMSVSAFAAAAPEGTSAEYKDGTVGLTGIDKVIDADHQWTVVVIKEADATKTLEAADLRYINQGNSADGFWTNMGTDVELTEGKYLVRIGGETITDATGIIEIPFEVTAGGIKVTLDYGDINGDGNVNNGDASLVLQKYVSIIDKFVDQEGRDIPEVVADVNGDGSVNNGDASLILQKYVSIITGFTNQDGEPLTSHTYTISK